MKKIRNWKIFQRFFPKDLTEKVAFLQENVKLQHNTERSKKRGEGKFAYDMFDAKIKGVTIFRISRSADITGNRLLDVRMVPVKDTFNIYFNDVPKGHEARCFGSMAQMRNFMAKYLKDVNISGPPGKGKSRATPVRELSSSS